MEEGRGREVERHEGIDYRVGKGRWDGGGEGEGRWGG